MAFATDTWVAASRWCSLRIASSAVWPPWATCASSSAAEGREARTVLPDAVHQLHHVCGVERAGERRHGPLPRRVDPGHVAVGGAPRRPGLHRLVGEPSQVLDECELQHAGPGPELADGQRGDGLESVEEAGQLLPIEAAVAVADQLDGEGVHPGVARQVAGRELGQLPVVAAREVLPDHADLRVHQVVVVEEPLARRGDELSLVHVGGEGTVGLPQDLGVVVEAGKDAPGLAPVGIHREAGGERAGALLQPLDAEQLVPERKGVEDRRQERFLQIGGKVILTPRRCAGPLHTTMDPSFRSG